MTHRKQSDATRQLTDIHFETGSLIELKTAHRQTVFQIYKPTLPLHKRVQTETYPRKTPRIGQNKGSVVIYLRWLERPTRCSKCCKHEQLNLPASQSACPFVRLSATNQNCFLLEHDLYRIRILFMLSVDQAFCVMVYIPGYLWFIWTERLFTATGFDI